jgi:hypothetical protein
MQSNTQLVLDMAVLVGRVVILASCFASCAGGYRAAHAKLPISGGKADNGGVSVRFYGQYLSCRGSAKLYRALDNIAACTDCSQAAQPPGGAA